MKKLIVLVSLVFSIFGSIVSFADEWKQDSTGWKYVYNDGTFVKEKWFNNPGTDEYYHFDSNGYMQSGVVNLDGVEYYFNDSGVLQRNIILSDGRRTDDYGVMFSDVNDGITIQQVWLTNVKVGNSIGVTVGIKNICDKPITFKKYCNIIRDGNVTPLYLYDKDTKSFYEEKTINPNETIVLNYIDQNKSEFYTDESSYIELMLQIDNNLYKCTSKIRTLRILHASAEKLKELGYAIN
jgi:hypothetical protein